MLLHRVSIPGPGNSWSTARSMFMRRVVIALANYTDNDYRLTRLGAIPCCYANHSLRWLPWQLLRHTLITVKTRCYVYFFTLNVFFHYSLNVLLYLNILGAGWIFKMVAKTYLQIVA